MSVCLSLSVHPSYTASALVQIRVVSTACEDTGSFPVVNTKTTATGSSSVSPLQLPTDYSSPLLCKAEEQEMEVQVYADNVLHTFTPVIKESHAENLGSAFDALEGRGDVGEATSSRLLEEEFESSLAFAESWLKKSVVSESVGSLLVTR